MGVSICLKYLVFLATKKRNKERKRKKKTLSTFFREIEKSKNTSQGHCKTQRRLKKKRKTRKHRSKTNHYNNNNNDNNSDNSNNNDNMSAAAETPAADPSDPAQAMKNMSKEQATRVFQNQIKMEEWDENMKPKMYPLEAGEVFLEETPYLAVLADKHKGQRCDCCFKSPETSNIKSVKPC